MMWTSNSWRRIGTADQSTLVCAPTTQPDGHPDLWLPNGGEDGPDARLIIAAPRLFRACMAALDDDIDRGGPLHGWVADLLRFAIDEALGGPTT